MNDHSIQHLKQVIDKSHFRSYPRVKSHVNKNIPAMDNKVTRRVVRNRVHDLRPTPIRVKPYQIKIFSNTVGSWQHDLLDNGKVTISHYWHVFINVNTRYAVALPLESKDGDAILNTLADFIDRYQPARLTSDKE